MVITVLLPFAQGIQIVGTGADSVVKSTFHLDTNWLIPHRESNAAAFGMCAGLACPTVTHQKGGR